MARNIMAEHSPAFRYDAGARPGAASMRIDAGVVIRRVIRRYKSGTARSLAVWRDARPRPMQ